MVSVDTEFYEIECTYECRHIDFYISENDILNIRLPVEYVLAFEKLESDGYNVKNFSVKCYELITMIEGFPADGFADRLRAWIYNIYHHRYENPQAKKYQIEEYLLHDTGHSDLPKIMWIDKTATGYSGKVSPEIFTKKAKTST